MLHTYTHAQAIDDGVLVDVTPTAKEAGFRVPVALTAAVWTDCVSWDQKRDSACQSEAGRLWDVLFLAALAAHRNKGAQVVPFNVLRVPHRGTKSTPVRLTMHIGPGDTAEPVVTITQPGEDRA